MNKQICDVGQGKKIAESDILDVMLRVFGRGQNDFSGGVIGYEGINFIRIDGPQPRIEFRHEIIQYRQKCSGDWTGLKKNVWHIPSSRHMKQTTAQCESRCLGSHSGNIM